MQEDKYIAWAMQTSKKWSDIESVIKETGIDFVDQDHRTLVEYSLSLNKVLDKSEKSYSIELLKETEKLLKDIHQYTKEHFRREEEFILDYQLPDYEEHKYEHDRILRMLEKVLSDFKQGKVNITRYLKLQILEWLLNHINIMDADFFKVENWGGNIDKANKWEDVKEIIKLIGNEMIDQQHKEMTELALDVISQIHYNSENDSVDKHCKRLIDYARYHFSCEAEFMKKYEIQGREKHLAIHDEFIELINEYREKIKKDNSHIAEMKKRVITWWIEHINKTDSDYFSYDNWGYKLLEEGKDLEEVLVILRKTGIEEIDLDHYKLLIKTMKLNELINKSEPKDRENSDKIYEILCDMYEYAVEHFRMEEEIMTQMKSEDLIIHKKEHEDILAQVMEMKEKYKIGKVVASTNLKAMILEWWIEHTNTTDYRTFVLHDRRKK